MLVFPAAKINLGLHVLRQRTDGYRDIETVMVPIPLHDALEAVIDPQLPNGRLIFSRSGLNVPGDPVEDLCVKAHGLLNANCALPGLRMHLHKVIPIGAGLGGGSSDGAHALKLLNELLVLRLGQTDLLAMAAELGSDCSFFMEGGVQLATGRGDVLVPLTVSLKGWWLVLLNPGIHVRTAEVYANTEMAPAKTDLAELITHSTPEEWSGQLVNVMESYVLKAYPVVAEAKRLLSGMGATYSAMSGSGSSVFGMFKDKPVLPALPSGHRGWVVPF